LGYPAISVAGATMAGLGLLMTVAWRARPQALASQLS